jgi:alpha/beta superfamily hydrolase
VLERGHFQSNGNRLYYEIFIPFNYTPKSGVIFVHAAEGNRLGPHRLFVELARQFNDMGLATMRFDLRGCGDSTGTLSTKDINQEVEDCLSAIPFFKRKANLQTISLLGISRGGRVCFSTLTNNSLDISTAILLSTPVSTTKATIKNFSFRLKEYVYKLHNPENLHKLVTGKTCFSGILKTLTKAVTVKKRYNPTKENTFFSKCPLLFIFGENDPIAGESSRYYKDLCDKSGVYSKFCVIKNANHSFFHYKWKQQATAICIEWLEDIIKNNEG